MPHLSVGCWCLLAILRDTQLSPCQFSVKYQHQLEQKQQQSYIFPSTVTDMFCQDLSRFQNIFLDFKLAINLNCWESKILHFLFP